MPCILAASGMQKLAAPEGMEVQSMCNGKHRPIQQNFGIGIDLLPLAPLLGLTDFVLNDGTQDE